MKVIEFTGKGTKEFKDWPGIEAFNAGSFVYYSEGWGDNSHWLFMDKNIHGKLIWTYLEDETVIPEEFRIMALIL